MGKVKIMTDSAHDLPASLLSELGINSVPMLIYFGEEEFKDGVDLSREEFFSRLADRGQLPKTAQPLLSEMRAMMLDLTADGSELVAIFLSSGLSGTYESAVMLAEEMPDRRIIAIDSRSASLGEGLIVLRAAEMALAGANAGAIETALLALIPRLTHLFTLDTLEYLMKGGRVSRTEAFVGTVLDVKPILHILDDGKIVALSRVRGRHKALTQLIDLAAAHITGAETQRIGVIHAHCREEGEALAAALRERIKPKDLILAEMTATVATHTGPGLLGVVFESDRGRL